MIDRQEIMELARELGLRPDVVEKDYVLGWILEGIYVIPEFKDTWLFKGGTCLKKCFFETFRFSEDLDFTVTDRNHADELFLKSTFERIANHVYEKSGIEMPIDLVKFEVLKNKEGRQYAVGKISYSGPLGRRGNLARIKLDLTYDEVVVSDSVTRKVHHPYSDGPDEGINATCYSFEELFAEKIRALSDRLRPRDLYDVVHLYWRGDITFDAKLIPKILREKCNFKNLPFPTMDYLEKKPERSELVSEWENMLAHQLPNLPSFDHFWNELPQVFRWLYEFEEKPVYAPIPSKVEIDSTWHAPATVTSWGVSAPMEIIRFAAANRLCVQLGYQGSIRLIEPYSLRRTKDGNILLHSIKHNTGEHRSYRIDRIESAEASGTFFTPKYENELTVAGPLSIQPAKTRESHSTSFGISRSPTRPRRTSSKRTNYGPKYIFECSYCGKKFTRSKYDTNLNPHKDKSGYQCAGRIGHYVDTKY